jgi:hypothetical protein
MCATRARARAGSHRRGLNQGRSSSAGANTNETAASPAPEAYGSQRAPENADPEATAVRPSVPADAGERGHATIHEGRPRPIATTPRIEPSPRPSLSNPPVQPRTGPPSSRTPHRPLTRGIRLRELTHTGYPRPRAPRLHPRTPRRRRRNQAALGPNGAERRDQRRPATVAPDEIRY